MSKSAMEDIGGKEATIYTEKKIFKCIIAIQPATFIVAAPIALRLCRQIRQFVIPTHNNGTIVGLSIHP